ncbi:MAG: hypothetical protein JHC95_07645 [Solirubrobacteraceae bacterium]|nr:hypothetical protein [Solirubrobacteraceae bacterium]
MSTEAPPSLTTTDRATARGAVLIAGGYGVVGTQIAGLLRARHPDLPLLLGGRSIERATTAAHALGAAGALLDVSAADPLDGLDGTPAAIVTAVNDADDRLLDAALAHDIPLVDITRWTARVQTAVARCAVARPGAPVLLASGWMAGVVPLLAAWAAGEDDAPAHRIDVAVRYELADRSGPDSFAYMDRFAERFEITIDGRQQLVPGLSDGRRATFADRSRARCYRFDTPEQFTLPVTLGVPTVATRIGFDSAVATRSMVGLRRVGALRALSHPRLTRIRHALLHQSGDGAGAQVRIDVHRETSTTTVHVADPLGQSHLTAAGALVAVERVLALDGAASEPEGARFSEQHPDPDGAVATLRACGVQIIRAAA